MVKTGENANNGNAAAETVKLDAAALRKLVVSTVITVDESTEAKDDSDADADAADGADDR